MSGEQRLAAADQPVQQCALRRAGGDGVDAAQQQRMMSQQQPPFGYLVDDRGGGVDRDRHRIDVIGRVTADQADRVPILCQPRRVGRLQHVDDIGQAGTHITTLVRRRRQWMRDDAG